MDLFGCERVKRLDSDSERFISFVHSIPIDNVRKIQEDTWSSFGELHSRIVVFGFFGVLANYLCPAKISHSIMCRL